MKIKTKGLFCVLILFSTLVQVQAQEQLKEHRKFWDKHNKIVWAISTALVAFDASQSCKNISNGAIEISLHAKHCPGIPLELFAYHGASLGLAYGFHRLHWYKAERIVPYERIGVSLYAIGYSSAHAPSTSHPVVPLCGKQPNGVIIDCKIPSILQR